MCTGLVSRVQARIFIHSEEARIELESSWGTEERGVMHRLLQAKYLSLSLALVHYCQGSYNSYAAGYVRALRAVRMLGSNYRLPKVGIDLMDIHCILVSF